MQQVIVVFLLLETKFSLFGYPLQLLCVCDVKPLHMSQDCTSANSRSTNVSWSHRRPFEQSLFLFLHGDCYYILLTYIPTHPPAYPPTSSGIQPGFTPVFVAAVGEVVEVVGGAAERVQGNEAQHAKNKKMLLFSYLYTISYLDL